jgi:protein TonB
MTVEQNMRHAVSVSARIPFDMEDDGQGVSIPIVTLIGWGLCLVVGFLGFVLPYSRPRPAVKPPEPLVVQTLQVELEKKPPPSELEPLPNDSAPSTADEMPPPPIAVAKYSPAIAFAVPVTGPTRVVPFNQATYVRPEPQPRAPVVQKLEFGQGEGKQIAPEYPRRALKERQEGSVVIRFVVGENGQVSSAEATQPCPWPLLNESALRTVREQWHFPPGNLRIYEIIIRFQLTE